MAKPQPSICSAVSRHEFGDISVSVPMHCTALDVQWHEMQYIKHENISRIGIEGLVCVQMSSRSAGSIFL